MGENKAGMALAGRSLLERALTTMGEVAGEVRLVGSVEDAPAGVVQLADRRGGCGPMGGMAAALRDCAIAGGSWAVFLPVDVPLLPGGLLRALMALWTSGETTTRIGVPIGDGRPQPLISVVHRTVLATMDEGLESGDYAVMPAFGRAAIRLAAELGAPADEVFRRAEVSFRDGGEVFAGSERLPWTPGAEEWSQRDAWFANANTQADFEELRGFVAGVAEKKGELSERTGDGEHLKVYP